MTNRVLTSGCIAAVVGAVVFAALPVAGQTPARNRQPLRRVRPGVPPPATGAKATKTPWGEPDSAGRLDERRGARHPARASREVRQPRRPDRRGVRRSAQGRRAAARRRRQRGRRVQKRRRVEDAVLSPDVDRRRARGRPHARVHRAGADAHGAARSRQLRRRPLQRPARLHALRSLHDARHRRVDHAGRLRQRQPHHPGAGHGHHQLRDGARHARHLHRRPSAPAARRSGSTWATRAATGKATRSSSRRRTSPTRPASAAATATACATAPTSS